MKVFYHNDMDGIVSARVILNKMRERKKEFLQEDFIKMDYSKKFPLDIITTNEEVFIVDYSISPEEMIKLLNKTKRVVWIDHHKSAIEKYKDFEQEISGLRANGIAGCVLTYWYFNGRQNETQEFLTDYPNNIKSLYRKEIPTYIKLAGDWDVWEHLYGEETRLFTISFNARISNPFADYYFDKFYGREELGHFIQSGEAMKEYRNSWAKEFMNRYGFETKIGGVSAFLANLGNANSEFFGDLIDKYDIIGTFCYNGETWTTSLYSNKNYVDCAEICSSYGGGGHKGAAGFVSKELLWR